MKKQILGGLAERMRGHEAYLLFVISGTLNMTGLVHGPSPASDTALTIAV